MIIQGYFGKHAELILIKVDPEKKVGKLLEDSRTGRKKYGSAVKIHIRLDKNDKPIYIAK